MTSTSTDRLAGTSSAVAVKAPVRVATTAAITLSGLQTIDGVTVVANDRVLVKNQADAEDNGIYVADSSTWARAKDWDGQRDAVDGSLVFVRAGSTNANFLFRAVAATAAVTIGTTEVTFELAASFDDAGTTGALIVAAETEDEAQDALGAGATGKALLAAATDDAAIESLLDGATADTSPADADTIPMRTAGGDGRAVTVADLLAALPLRGYLAGLTLSRNATATSLDIAAGVARDGSNADFMVLAAITKSLNATFVVGTGEGGLDTGAKANSTWYHVWLIKRVDTDVVDVLFSTSVSSPTMPANYTLKRRIGSIKTDSSGDITLFSQNGDEFLWSAAVLDIDVTNAGTSAVSRTLSVPTGVKVDAIFNTMINHLSTDFAVYHSALDTADAAVSSTAAPLADIGSTTAAGETMFFTRHRIRTNTSAQIRTRQSASSTNDVYRLATLGWVDTRGRND